MDNKNTAPTTRTQTADPAPTASAAPRPGDLDDLIFRGQSWLISDR